MTNPNATVTNQINKPAGAPVLAKPAVESVIANAPVKESPPAAIAEVPKAPMLPGDRIPANWHVQVTDEEGVITAFNSTTQKTFTGKIKDFSNYMRSE